MKFRVALFDLDGTVLNTLDDLADAANAVLVANKMPQHTKDEIRMFVGNGIRKLIERAVPAGTDEETILKVLGDFKAYYGAHCAEKTAPYAGVLLPYTASRLKSFTKQDQKQEVLNQISKNNTAGEENG